MATARQVRVYGMHRSLCQRFGITQGTLKHKSLQGTLAAASATGNVVYTPPGPTTTGPVTTDTLVWLATQPAPKPRAMEGESTAIGREGLPELLGQIPAIDDTAATISIAHDDLVVDMAGITYRIMSPVVTPDNSTWSFGMVKER